MKNLFKTALVVLAVAILISGCDKKPVDQPKPEVQQESQNSAPSFTLADQNGKSHSLADYSGKIVVLEWTNPDCPFVKRHYKAQTMVNLAQKYAPQGVVWLAINSTNYADTAMNLKFVKDYDLQYPVLDDKDGKIGRLYGASTTPNMFIIDASGQIAYHGAIDDNPSGNKTGITNYVKIALNELIDGDDISIPTVKTYGCSVKYAE